MKIEESERRTVTVGRYLLHRQIARGGMATIHIARLMGDEGFSRIVAAKRLLPEFAEDTEFVSMFMDEARIASKVHHPNVVPVLDLVTTTDEVMLVQEYVHGVPLHVLLRTAHEGNAKIPVRIAVSIAAQVLAGLHAAHTTLDEMGTPLAIVHRDVSPQNVMIAIDGSARLLDFGVAKATMAAHVTRDGTFKGKLAYSAPEQVRGKPVQQSDVYALSVVLWELLVGHRMHGMTHGEAELVATIVQGKIPSITEALSNEADWGAIDSENWKLISAIEPIVEKGLAIELDHRYRTAAEMEEALTKAVPPASSSEVAAWVKALGKPFIEGRDKIIAAEEASWRRNPSVAPTQTGINRRATMSELRTIHPPTHVGSPPAPPPAPALPLQNHKTMFAVLGALVVLLGVGVVFAMRSGDDVPVASAQPAPEVPAPASEVPSEPSPTPAIDVDAAPLAAAAAELPGEKPATRDAPPVRRTPARPEPRPAVKTDEKKEREKERDKERDKEPPPPPSKEAVPEVKPSAAEKPKDDCNPPYYFQGPKKVFKPNCL